MIRWVVFSDLDGTLLDARSYSFEPARPALEELRRLGVPLVLCTSKTAAETMRLQQELGIYGPWEVEGGGGIYLPKRYFDALFPSAVERGGWVLLPLGTQREIVVGALREIRAELGVPLRGFAELSVGEVSAATGLPPDRAALAREREFDEPFLLEDESGPVLERLRRLASARGLDVSRGGRFWHLHGGTDKGRAVAWLKALFHGKLGGIRTVGVGDSAMDLPMLAAVDYPVAVLRPDGTHDGTLCAGIPGLHRATLAGPEGWNEAILQVLGSA